MTVFSQVVAGFEYQFDIVLKHSKFLVQCQGGMGHGDRCHVVVYDVPWENKREVDWDKTNCSRKNPPPEQGKHTMQSGAISLVETLCSIWLNCTMLAPSSMP